MATSAREYLASTHSSTMSERLLKALSIVLQDIPIPVPLPPVCHSCVPGSAESLSILLPWDRRTSGNKDSNEQQDRPSVFGGQSGLRGRIGPGHRRPLHGTGRLGGIRQRGGAHRLQPQDRT